MTDPTTTSTEPLIPELRAALLTRAAERPAAAAPGEHDRVARPWFRRPRRVLVAGAVVGATAVAAIAVVGPGGEAGTPTPVRAGSAPGGATVPARTVRQAQTEFAVFRGPVKTRPASSGSATPGTAAGRTASDENLFVRFPEQISTIVDPENARRLNVPNREVWVAPGDREGAPQICMRMRSTLDSGILGTCGPLALAREHGAFMSGRPAPDSPNAAKHEYVGLLPDGVTAVTFLLRDGSTREEAVHDNAVAVVSETGIRGVRFVDAGGKQQTLRF